MTIAQLNKLIASFDWAKWEKQTRAAFADDFKAIADAQGEVEGKSLSIEFDAQDPFLEKYFTAYVGERITQLSESTRETVTNELHAVLEHATSEEAVGATELAGRLSDAVSDSAAFSPSRALMIARTETAIAYNVGAIFSFQQAGVEYVEVSDGDDDEDCADADGAIWTLDEALADPVAHPNCVRAFAPYIEDGSEQEAV